MNRRKRAITITIIVPVTALVLTAAPETFFYLLQNPASYAVTGIPGIGLPVGANAPDFTITTTDGLTFSLGENRGKVVLLDFMATWCYPCRQQISDLLRVHSKYARKGLVILSIDIDPRETPAQLAEWKEAYGAKWAYAIDTASVNVTLRYRVSVIPTTYIIDQYGLIVSKDLGYVPAKQPQATWLSNLIKVLGIPPGVSESSWFASVSTKLDELFAVVS